MKHAARAGYELMACAWPEPPSAKLAGARDGVEALAFCGTETHVGSHTTFRQAAGGRRLRPAPLAMQDSLAALHGWYLEQICNGLLIGGLERDVAAYQSSRSHHIEHLGFCLPDHRAANFNRH